MSLTDQQSAAAFATDPSIAVVAGAGTGKTRVLTERYLHLVLERAAQVPRILTVTFTEKAAREMKERIRKALQERGRLDLARLAEFAPISTIHAFLSKILRERALDAGVDPRFVVADQLTSELYLEEAVRETVAALPAEARAPLIDLALGEESLQSLYLAARATPFEMEELRPVEPDLEALGERLRRFLEECARQGPTAQGTRAKLHALQTLKPRLLALDAAVAAEFTECVKGRVADAQRDLFKEGKELAKEYAPLEHLLAARATGAAFVTALQDLDRRYTARKRADGLLDFSDLEREGLKLLRSSAGAAIAAEYDHLLVDEYQDTSRIQEAILDLLACGGERFGVGDEKQSIYRFRYADAQVFLDLQARAARYPLGGSFRSRPELLSFTNRLFQALFFGGDVRPQDLHAEAGWDAKAPPSVEAIYFEAPSAKQGRRKEARALARRLRAIVEGEELATRDARPLSYRDCAILLRTMSELSVYERALADEGVPYVVLKGRGYYAAREVVDLAHLLVLLTDPWDDFRAVAALTSLMGGATEGDLLHLQELADGPLPLRALGAERPDGIPPERWERLRRFARGFQRWRALQGKICTGDLIEEILSDTRFMDLLLLERDGRRRRANLQKAMRRARQAHEDPATYARALLEFREREMRESEAPISAETDEAVKIMTVHTAKGLEFPLVAVADLTTVLPKSRGPILRPDGVFGFRLRGDPKSIEPPGFTALKTWEHRQEMHERLRLLYVALTRAEEHLILSGSHFPRCMDLLLERVERENSPEVRFHDVARLLENRRHRGARAVRAAVRRMAPLPGNVERDDERARVLLARIESVSVPAPDETPYVAAVADLVEFARCPRRYRLNRMLRIEPVEATEGSEPADAEEHPRRLLGTAFHEVMKEVGPGTVPDEATIRRSMPGATAKDVDKMRGWAEWLAGLDLVRRIGDAKIHPEMPFLTRIADLPVRGVIDLYVPSLPLLVDYKTGARVRAEEYAVQVAVYLAALRGLGFPAPEAAHLVYVDAQEVVEVKEEPVDELVRRFVDAHRDGGAFEPQPGDPCIHCEYRKACVRNGVACPAALRLF